MEDKSAAHGEDAEKEGRAIFQHLKNAVSWDCSLEKARSVSIVTKLFRFPSICVTLDHSVLGKTLGIVQDSCVTPTICLKLFCTFSISLSTNTRLFKVPMVQPGLISSLKKKKELDRRQIIRKL